MGACSRKRRRRPKSSGRKKASYPSRRAKTEIDATEPKAPMRISSYKLATVVNVEGSR